MILKDVKFSYDNDFDKTFPKMIYLETKKKSSELFRQLLREQAIGYRISAPNRCW